MQQAPNEPLTVLQQARAALRTPRAERSDFWTPTRACHIEVPAPGLVHPAHVGWVADCLGWSTARVRETLTCFAPDSGSSAIAHELERATGPGVARLAKLGVKPTELMLRTVPVGPSSTRRNPRVPGSGPLLSAVNAALSMLDRQCRNLERFIDMDAPPIIIEARAMSLQQSFESLLDVLQGRGPRFLPEHQPSEEPSSLIILPSRPGGIIGASSPCGILVEGTTALIRFPAALARVDLESGSFTVHPFGEAAAISLVDRRALFNFGSQIMVFDVDADAFSIRRPRLPSRVLLGACCGIDVLDVATRTVATMPGPLASSGFDCCVSPCGRYGWLHVLPRVDEVGIFSLTELASVHQPWPHAVAGFPRRVGPSGEGHDSTARACVQRSDGSFLVVYGSRLYTEHDVHRLHPALRAANFDVAARTLVTLDPERLRVHQLDRRARPRVLQRWSLRPLLEHVAPSALPLEDAGLELDHLMAQVGTATQLAEADPAALTNALGLPDESVPAVKRLISAAAITMRSTNLTRRG